MHPPDVDKGPVGSNPDPVGPAELCPLLLMKNVFFCISLFPLPNFVQIFSPKFVQPIVIPPFESNSDLPDTKTLCLPSISMFPLFFGSPDSSMTKLKGEKNCSGFDQSWIQSYQTFFLTGKCILSYSCIPF